VKNSLFALIFLFSITSLAEATLGKPAPDFTLQGIAPGKDAKLENFKLSDPKYKGKIVVLEWFNEGCPFVRKHYNAGNMQRLQSEYTKPIKDGVIWFTIASSAKGKQGYVDEKSVKQASMDHHMANTALLIDKGSKVAALYGAKTTPHMFVIDAKGVLVYEGAIDSDSTAKPMDLEKYKADPTVEKYAEAAIKDLRAGGKVTVASKDPYGCSVKY
jgi:hypothetical protein